MKKLLLPLLIIVAIEFNLASWGGFANAPNWFKAWDEHGNRLEATYSWVMWETGWAWTAIVQGEKFLLIHTVGY